MGSIPQLSIVKGPTRQLYPKLLHKLFEATASESKRAALIFEENGQVKKQSYQDLDRLTNQLARSIRNIITDNNLQRNSDGDYIVAVNLSPSDNSVAILLGIWKAGAAYLPLDHAFPGPRIEHIIRESKPCVVIYDKDSPHYVNTYKISMNEILNKAKSEKDYTLGPDECVHHLKDDLAIVLYTSGSTGVPKGVRLPHRVILNRLQWQFKTFPFKSNEHTCVFKTALTFVDSVAEIWGPLINGLSLVVVPKEVTIDPEKLVGVLENYQIERIVLVPTLLRSVLMYLELQKQEGLLSQLKLWVCSGESLPVSLAEEFFKYFSTKDYKLCNFYGSTEVMGDVTYHVISSSQELAYLDKVPIGVPVDNTIIYLLDGDFRPVKSGDVGELFVSGLNLAAGYVAGRDPEKFVNNPLAIDPTFAKLYRTGDFARLEKGEIIYEGRTDSQVKVRGHRVDLSEIEKALITQKEVEKAVVLCYKPGEMNQAILAFVTSRYSVSENQIEIALKKKLAGYMVPQVIFVENIPLLVNGKIDRQTLLKNYENANYNDDNSHYADIDYAGVPKHQMEAAKTLFDIVASVLGRSARSVISVDANFYEIGGNSLNSIYTISKLNVHGYHITIGDFIAAIDLGEILERMTSDTLIKTQPPRYISELLKDEYKVAVLDMITTSFLNKADLEQWLMPDITEGDYVELIAKLWEPLLEKNLSLIAKNDAGKIVGVALNFDARDEPEVEVTSKLSIIFEFLEHIEGPTRDEHLPNGKGKILHAFMMATHSSLNGKENVAVMKFLEDEVLKLATEKKFAGVFTTNTSPLTQQLGTDVFEYQTLLDYQVNEYIAPNNTKPFGLAPDSQRAVVQWKSIE